MPLARTRSKDKAPPFSLRGSVATFKTLCPGCGRGYLTTVADTTQPRPRCCVDLDWVRVLSKAERRAQTRRQHQSLIQAGA